jgi:thiol-disulfide isomerase/thioredoxin
MRFYLALTMGMFLVLCSCGPEEPAENKETSPAETSRGAAKEMPEPQLRQVDLEGLRDRIEAHRGKVVLVDVWATWCRPCVKAWPKLVRLVEEYKKQGLVVLTLSTDAPEKTAAVKDFLGKHGAPGESLHLKARNYDDFVTQLGTKWEGGVPAVLLYGRNGKLRYELIGARATDDLEDKVEKLLREGG